MSRRFASFHAALARIPAALANGPLAAVQVADAVGYGDRAHANRFMMRAQRYGVAHLAHWVPSAVGHPVGMWVAGPGENAPCPYQSVAPNQEAIALNKELARRERMMARVVRRDAFVAALFGDAVERPASELPSHRHGAWARATVEAV